MIVCASLVALIAVGFFFFRSSPTISVASSAQNESPEAFIPNQNEATDPGDTDPGDTERAPTKEEIAAAEEKLAAQIEAGWVPFEPSPAIEGAFVPADLWIPIDLTQVNPAGLNDAPEAQGAVPVFDAPDGNIVGYEFIDAGYVGKEELAGFDLEAAKERQRQRICASLNEARSELRERASELCSSIRAEG